MERQPVAFDTETALIAPGLLAPPLVCVSYADEDGQGLVHQRDAKELVQALLESDRLLIGANVAYDFAVIAAKWPEFMPAIFQAYEDDRITDVLIREKLRHIARGIFRGYEDTNNAYQMFGYSLEDIVERRLKVKLGKEDSYRLRYGELIDVPLEQWPEAATEYAITDAVTTLEVYRSQEKDQEHERVCYLNDQYRQTRAAWWLHLTSAWGLCTDPVAVAAFARGVQVEYDKLAEKLLAVGFLKVDLQRNAEAVKRRYQQVVGPIEGRLTVKQLQRSGDPLLIAFSKTGPTKGQPDNRTLEQLVFEDLIVIKLKKDTKAVTEHIRSVCAERNIELVLTDKGAPKIDRDTCDSLGDPLLCDYASLSSLSKKLTTDVPLLERGTRTPIQPRFESLLATGRTSSSPNVQNLPRKGGIRECFIPRPGMVFAAADYSAFELRTVAQVCCYLFKHSALADALNKGFDPHLEIARRLVGCSYEEAVTRQKAGDDVIDNARQVGKVANFGFPGGLGVKSFVDYARKGYGVTITETEAASLKKYWIQAWPEFNAYFKYFGDLCEHRNSQIQQLYVDRYRGGVSFCEACNSMFQGLAADSAKNAGFLIARACYVEPKSPLFGGHIVNFVHDEFIVEVPDDELAHDAAVEVSRLMCEGAAVYLTDVPPKAEPYLMRRWSKKAKPKYDANGRLVPWELPSIAG